MKPGSTLNGSRLFRKHLLFTSGAILVFVFVGLTASFLALEFDGSQSVGNLPTILAHTIELGSAGPEAALLSLRELNRNGNHQRFWLLGERGEVLYPRGQSFPQAWNSVPHPQEPYEARRLEERTRFFSNARRTIVRLQGSPARYLVVDFARGWSRIQKVFLFNFGAMVLAVVLGTALSFLALYRSLGKRVQEADQVISQLQGGNLKARFPIRKRDEVGKAMLRFNRMADEIERLVERLKSSERGRIALLQELAHDLRTPIASLKNLLETLALNGAKLDPRVREEFTSLSLREVEYFERLVEDLLVLAQVSEPRYKLSTEMIQIESLLTDELESYSLLHAGLSERKVLVERSFALPGFPIPGDAQLLRRLFRNALDNSFSFARGTVTIKASGIDGDRVEVLVQDDGSGLNEEGMKAFGERRGPRFLDPRDSTNLQDSSETHGESRRPGRLSVGLGSVIMKAITTAHRGEMSIRNRQDGFGRVLGAELRIVLPTH